MDNPTALEKFEQHLRRRSPDRSTPLHYLSDLRQFFAVCPKPWADVTRAEIDAFVEHGLTQGWKSTTLQRRLAALKVFFAFCADEVDQPDRLNPVVLERHAPRRGERLPRDLSAAVLDQLWLAIDQPRDQVWFTLMLRAGLRVGEVVTLKRGDVLAPATNTVPARLRVLGKGRKERIVYLSADAYAVLTRWLAELPETLDTPLCPNQRGQPMTVNGLQERLRHYAAKAGVQVTCHQLRHTFACQLVEHDLPVTTLAKLMGHESLSTTQVYLAGADPHVRQAYQDAMSRWAADPPPTPAPSPSPAPESASPPPPVPPPPLVTFDAWGPSLPAWVREACLAYVRHRQKDWKPSRRARNGKRVLCCLAVFWAWQLAHRSVAAWSDLTRADLQAFITCRIEHGCAPTTVTNDTYAVLGVLRLRQAQGTPIPASVFRVEFPKDPELAPRALSEADAQRLERPMHNRLVQDTSEARRDAVAYFLLAHTGIRLSELLDLKRADVDLVGGRLRIEEAKGRRDRIVYLSPTCQRALERYCGAQPAAADTPLVCHASGKPVAYSWVQTAVRRWGQDAGVMGVSPHRLRHTFATRLINLGVPVTTLQRLLGHRDLSTTQRYAYVMDKTVEHDYQQAMTEIERTLLLAPMPLTTLTGQGVPLPPAAAPSPVPVTKVPVDNSL